MASALASETTSIFDILNLYMNTPPKPPNPNTSHRYYLCREPPEGNRFKGPITCTQIKYSEVLEFCKAKETTPTKDFIAPIDSSRPRALDAAFIATRVLAPVVISNP